MLFFLNLLLLRVESDDDDESSDGSRIAAVPQAQRRPRLILNLSAPPDKETPSVNDTTDR